MFKKATVVMLPTNEKANIFIDTIKEGLLVYIKSHIDAIVTWKDVKYQHLYIVSDDKIEDNDWCIDLYCVRNYFSNKIKQNINLTKGTLNCCKKIIATTDQSLSIHWNKQDHKSLPQTSQQFIEKYIEKYNKGNIITEVMVEWDYYPKVESETIPEYNKIKVNPKDNTINIRRIKDSWNRNELVEVLNLWSIECGITDAKETVNNWIKNNL